MLDIGVLLALQIRDRMTVQQAHGVLLELAVQHVAALVLLVISALREQQTLLRIRALLAHSALVELLPQLVKDYVVQGTIVLLDQPTLLPSLVQLAASVQQQA